MSKKKPNEASLLSVVEPILTEQGISFADWKRKEIQFRKLAILEDKDKQWQEMVLEEAAIGVVKDYLTQMNAPLPSQNTKYKKEGDKEDVSSYSNSAGVDTQ